MDAPLRALRLFLVVAVCAASCVAQVLAPISSPAAHAGPAPDAHGYFQMHTAIGDDYFDGKDSVARIRRHLHIAREAGVRYLRCAFSWNGIEPQQGTYNLQFWDTLVEQAWRAGIELIPYVAYTPKWAAGEEDGFWKHPPRDPAAYATVMRMLATRYRGKIRHWELWNEPDNKEYWDGSPDEFAATVILGAKAVREAAPEDVLVLGGMSHGPGSFFDVLISRYHLEQYVDVLALHAYPESWHEERAETVFGNWINDMGANARRSGRALWLNEMGYADYRFEPSHASLWGTNVFYNYEHTPRYTADFLFKSFVMTLGSGHVSLAGWYRIDDFREDDVRMPSDKVHHHLGLTFVNGKKKPAFYALRFFNSLFSQPVRLVEASTPVGSLATVRTIERKDGKIVIAGWLRSSTYSEVAVHSGMERDRRGERLRLALPCKAETINTFDATGKKISTQRTPMLEPVDLTGDQVFIAEVTCARRVQTRPAQRTGP